MAADGSECLYELLIQSNGWFIQEWSKRLFLFMNGALNHWLTRFVQNSGFIQKRNTAVLLGDTQQFCNDFIGNIFVGKTEQKQTILYLKYNTILTYYLLYCCIKSHLHSGQTALVWYCSLYSLSVYAYFNMYINSIYLWICIVNDPALM